MEEVLQNSASLRATNFAQRRGNTIEEGQKICQLFYTINDDGALIPSALIGGGIAWFLSKHVRNRNIGSRSEPLMLCTRAGKPCPEAITAREVLVTFDGTKVTGEEPMKRFMPLKGTFRKSVTGRRNKATTWQSPASIQAWMIVLAKEK